MGIVGGASPAFGRTGTLDLERFPSCLIPVCLTQNWVSSREEPWGCQWALVMHLYKQVDVKQILCFDWNLEKIGFSSIAAHFLSECQGNNLSASAQEICNFFKMASETVFRSWTAPSLHFPPHALKCWGVIQLCFDWLKQIQTGCFQGGCNIKVNTTVGYMKCSTGWFVDLRAIYAFTPVVEASSISSWSTLPSVRANSLLTRFLSKVMAWLTSPLIGKVSCLPWMQKHAVENELTISFKLLIFHGWNEGLSCQRDAKARRGGYEENLSL